MRSFSREARDEYGTAHIYLDAVYTAGGYDSSRQLTGIAGDRINVIVTASDGYGAPGASLINRNGRVLSQIDMNKADDETLAHELAHHILGDTRSVAARVTRWLAENEPRGLPAGIVGIFSNAIADTYEDGLRQGLRTPDAVAAYSGTINSKVNAGARSLQELLNKPGALRPRQ